jgi:hypothetical protein
MIFWTGSKVFYHPFLVRTAKVENVCISNDIFFYASRSYRDCYAYFRKNGGLGVLREIAIMSSEKIDIYEYFGITFKDKNQKENLPKFSIPIVNELDDIDNFPESIALRTENVELLQELIARGKKITWITPNLSKFSHLLAQLKFEHLIIDPFTENDLVFPTGEYKDNFFSQETVTRTFSLLKGSKLPFAKVIGFSFLELTKNFYDLRGYRRKRKQMRKNVYDKRFFLGHYFAVAYYNILSITYMLCKKSFFATNVKKKSVFKD